MSDKKPVAWIRQRDNTLALSDGGVFGDDWTPLYYAALAQPEPEPVTWRYDYTRLPRRKPLTAEVIREVLIDFYLTPNLVFGDVVRAIERAHGIGGES